MTHPLPDSPFGPELWDVLARYGAGESPSPEAEAVRSWLAERPGRAEAYAFLMRTVDGLAFRPPADLDIGAAWRQVADRIRDEDRSVVPIDRTEHARRRWRTMGLRAAAALALLLGGGLVWRAARSGGAAVPIAARIYDTPAGRADSITLDDGSRVILAPLSSLEIAAGYGTPVRAVALRGEALFDVVHDEQHPFRVQAGRAVIEDLGTTFAVRNDGDEPVRVAVTAGSVRLWVAPGQGQGQGPGAPAGQRGRDGVVLKAGDRGAVDREGRPMAQPAAVTPDDLAWTRGRLVFDNAPLARVRADLRRWYGVELRIDDPALAERHLTASFSGEPLQRVLDVIGLALGARIERYGDTAVVRASPR